MFVIDRAIRILIGIAILIVFGLIYPTWWCFLGLFPLITGVSGIYPIREVLILLGYRENPNAKKDKNSKKTKATEEKVEKARKPAKTKKAEKPQKDKKFTLFAKKPKKDILSQSPVFND